MFFDLLHVRIRIKLLGLVLLPVVGGGLLSGLVVAEQTRLLERMQRLRAASSLSVSVGNVVHALQAESAGTALYLGSEGTLQAAMAKGRDAVDREQVALDAALSEAGPGFKGGLPGAAPGREPSQGPPPPGGPAWGEPGADRRLCAGGGRLAAGAEPAHAAGGRNAPGGPVPGLHDPDPGQGIRRPRGCGPGPRLLPGHAWTWPPRNGFCRCWTPRKPRARPSSPRPPRPCVRITRRPWPGRSAPSCSACVTWSRPGV